MRKARAIAMAAISSVIVAGWAGTAWYHPTGCVSSRNYERIEAGMTREELDVLLGSPGEEEKNIPNIPAYIHLPGAPPGWTGCVWGDTFVCWKVGSREIYVGFEQGLVTSKFLIEPSL